MKVIIKKELCRIFGNKGAYLFALIMPILFILLFAFMLQRSATMTKNYDIWVYCEDEALVERIDAVVNEHTNVKYIRHAYEEKDVRDGKATVAISIAEHIDFFYDANLVSNTKAIYQAEIIANELSMQLADTALLVEYKAVRVPIEEVDSATDEERLNASFAVFFPFMYMLLLGIVNFFIVSLATDMISGERERGTWDAIILTGTSQTKLLIGKCISIMCEAVPVYLIGFLSTIIGCRIFERGLGEITGERFLQRESIATMLLLGCSLAILASSIFLLISTYFDKARNARAYAGVGTLLFSILSAMNKSGQNRILDYFPVVNVVGTMINILHGRLNFGAVVYSSALALGMAGIIFLFADRQIRRQR